MRHLNVIVHILFVVNNSKGIVKTHMERYHSKERRYECSFCNQKFKTNGDLMVKLMDILSILFYPLPFIFISTDSFQFRSCDI